MRPTRAQGARGATELSLSRLVCPRMLEPDTDYIACVVPTFELGRKAGLGDGDQRHRVDGGERAGAAWSMTADRADERRVCRCYLPLAIPDRRGRRLRVARAPLHPRPSPDGLGKRRWISASPASRCRRRSRRRRTLELEGALRPLERRDLPRRGRHGARSRSRTALADIVNAPGLAADRRSGTPIRCSRRRCTANGMRRAPTVTPARSAVVR